MANNYNGVILFNPPDILNPSDFRSRLPKPTLVVGSNNRLTENGLFETLSESGEEAGKIAINYLASLGHKEIAYLGDAPDGGSLFLERRKGIEEAMRDNGIASRIRIFGTLHNNLNSDFGYSQMNGIIQLRNCPTAILAGSEFIAAGVMKAITEAGLSVPRDISVMAFGGESYENYLSPKLTSVEVSSDQLAAAQVRWVLKSIKQKPGYQGAGLEKPTPMLTIRESTGKAPNVEV